MPSTTQTTSPAPPDAAAQGSTDLQAVPVTYRDGTGRERPAQVVGPQWTRQELYDLVRGEAERGLITSELAEQVIAADKAQQQRG